MAYVPNSGSVVAFQDDPSKLQASVTGTVTVRNPQSVSGTVGASVIGHAPVVIVGGSIAASFTPPANQSVSGEVSISNFPVSQNVNGSVIAVVTNFPTTQNVSGSVVAFQGTSPWVVAPNNSSMVTIAQGSVAVAIISGSVAVSVTPPANQSVSGTVQAEQIGAWRVSVINSTPSSLLAGVSVIGLTPVNVTNFPTTQNVSGSVVAFQGTSPWLTVPTSGSVIATQGGTRITSVVNSIPSSLLAGVSVIGLTPVNVTNTNINVSGSVAAFQAGTQSPSVYGMRNDAVASFLGANLTVRPMATDAAGRTLTKPFAAEEARIEGYHSVVSTSQTTLVAAAGAGLRNYITDIWIANTGATTALITFKDGANSVLGYTIAPTGGGSNLPGLFTPIRTGVNTTFDIQPATASSVIYATVKGFKAP